MQRHVRGACRAMGFVSQNFYVLKNKKIVKFLWNFTCPWPCFHERFLGCLAIDNQNRVKTVAFSTRLKLSESANFNNLKPVSLSEGVIKFRLMRGRLLLFKLEIQQACYFSLPPYYQNWCFPKSANKPLPGMLSETTAVVKTRPMFRSSHWLSKNNAWYHCVDLIAISDDKPWFFLLPWWL